MMNVSASQIKTFRLCRRKWALEKVAGVEAPETPQQRFGKDVHAALEAWVRDGTPIPDTDPGRAAMAAVRHTAPPGDPTATVETWFEFPSPTVEGVKYRGFIDLAWVPPGGVTECLDYKTTVAGFRWAMGQAELTRDPQFLIYAYALMVHMLPTIPALDLKWLYLARSADRPAAHPVRVRVVAWDEDLQAEQAFDAVVTLGVVEAGVRDLDEVVRDMIRVRDDCAGDAMRAPVNAKACGAFGGCPYVGICNLSPREKMESIMGMESIKARLEARKAAAAGAAPKAAETQPDQGDGINSPPRGGTIKAATNPLTLAKAVNPRTVTGAPGPQAGDVRAALHVLADAIADKLGVQ